MELKNAAMVRSTVPVTEKLSDAHMLDFTNSIAVTKETAPQGKWSKLDFVLSVLIVTGVIAIYIYF